MREVSVMAGSKTLDEQIAQAQKRVRELKRRKVARERAESAAKWETVIEVFPELDEDDPSALAQWLHNVKQVIDRQTSGK
jgi:hypothetical protein